MRLGQLARKYEIPIDKIISYINEHGDHQSELSPNSRLDEETKDLVAEHFQIDLDSSSPNVEDDNEALEEPTAEPVEEREIAAPTPNGDEEILLPESEYEELPRENENFKDIERPLELVEDKEAIDEDQIIETVDDRKSIDTDQLMELLESEDADIDLSDISLIKVPKKELSGLKVLGKIELEEAKIKVTEENKEEELEDASNPESDSEKQEREFKREERRLAQEEREAKRLKFKKRREEYEAKQAKLEKERELDKIKSLKKARYEQNIKQSKPNKPRSLKEKVSIVKEEEVIELVEQRPKPKTIFGKFWRWLDASS